MKHYKGRISYFAYCWEAEKDEERGMISGLARWRSLVTLARTSQWSMWTKPAWTAGRREDMELSHRKDGAVRRRTASRRSYWKKKKKNGCAVRLSSTSPKWNPWRHFKPWWGLSWWLRLWASTVRGSGLIPDQGTKLSCAMWHSQQQTKNFDDLATLLQDGGETLRRS